MDTNLDELFKNRKDAPPYIPNCWICMDIGIVTFDENQNERGARCVCEKGKRFANAGIASVDKFLDTKELARKNKEEFEKIYGEDKEVMRRLEYKLKQQEEDVYGYEV